MQTDSADWLEGLEIDGEASPAEPAPDTPDWLKGLAEEGADGDEIDAAPAADWLREIGEPGSVSDEQAAETAATPPEDEQVEPAEVAPSGGAPDWLQGVGSAAEEDAQALAGVTPEPEDLEVETPLAPAEEDSEVMDWLHDLAAKQAEAPDDEELEATTQVEAATPVIQDRDIPDAPEEGLEWLEQLADQRGMDVDVSAPGQTASPPSSSEPEVEPDTATAPGWLGRMATQPIPKVDMEALEAAARGEEVSPDAETIDAQAADIQAQLDEVILEREADIGTTEVAPDDITIEARASDLQAEMEQEAESMEPVSSPGEGASDEEIPDWLIAAAEQAEPPTEAPSEPPAEFVEAADELEVETEPSPSDEQEIAAEASQLPEPDIVEDMEHEASISEVASGEEDLQEIQPSEASAEDVDFEWFDAGEAADMDDDSQVELVEAEQPEDAAPDEVEELGESETTDIEIAEPVSETKKKEDLLERSRQALASGASIAT
jgi:hypothetical protein